MAKVKIKKKFKHSGTLEEDLKNSVVTKNKILKKKKKGNKASEKKTKKKRKDDVQKILNLANRQNEEDLDYSDYGNRISGDDLDDGKSQQVDKFLQFDDDIGEEGVDHDVSDQENLMADKMVFSAEQINHYDRNQIDESSNILDDLDVKINPHGIEKGAKLDKGKDVKAEQSEQEKLDALVQKCYETIGEELAHYKKGKLHRALTVLVKSPRWFDLLLLTKPKRWTTQATFEVTRLFSSGLKEKEVCIYYEFILLPIILDNIEKNKKLETFLYKTLIKALYKSKAWMRGMLYPLLRRECTKKELAIFGSVVQKMSIAINTTTQCLQEIFTFPWNSSISHFLCLFFNKKYGFSKEFIEKCVDYFASFLNYPNVLTVNWYTSLLLLVQNYRALIGDDEIEKLRVLVMKKNHPKFSSEILKSMYSPTTLMSKIKDLASHPSEDMV
ncbi:Bystin [Plasmodium coatneyi]|uniref:Bystin n=1 Tax=Plasmodium coatneyi TaxID=208452 RepID=A0A1B1DZ17_9APIC|nr:Bystin [Plasmodium coatneyi]ANQ08023.1 Bystin [Plasmodium coatneyi]